MLNNKNSKHSPWIRYQAAQRKLGLWPFVYFIAMIILFEILYLYVSHRAGKVFLGVTLAIDLVLQEVLINHYMKDDALVEDYLNDGPRYSSLEEFRDTRKKNAKNPVKLRTFIKDVILSFILVAVVVLVFFGIFLL